MDYILPQESLLQGNKAKIILKPTLKLHNGSTVSLTLLEKCTASLKLFNKLDNIS
jgi:hypothetical protein